MERAGLRCQVELWGRRGGAELWEGERLSPGGLSLRLGGQAHTHMDPFVERERESHSPSVQGGVAIGWTGRAMVWAR